MVFPAPIEFPLFVNRSREHSEDRVAPAIREPPAGTVRYIVSDRPGWWFSDCGRYAIFRMLSGTIYEQWELYRRGKNHRGEPDDCHELISTDLALIGFTFDKKLK